MELLSLLQDTSSENMEGWEDVMQQFFSIVLKSPVAIVGFALSFLLGYGISFILFDYRKENSKKASTYFHLGIGLGYTATVFILCNFDLVTREINYEHILGRVPFTMLISFVLAFFILISGALYRQYKPSNQ